MFPVLMSIGHHYYESGNLEAIERLFLPSVELCKNHPIWQTNVAHTFFVHGTKYEDAIRYYESILQKHSSLLDVTPVILANLCASYIMINEVRSPQNRKRSVFPSQTEMAEDLMRKLEVEEAQSAETCPLHSCIVNLIIGTLYCSNGNYEFGISRVIKSFDPIENKLDDHTWVYARKCFYILLQHLAKHMIQLTEDRFAQIVEFLHAVEQCRLETTISDEAALIRTMFCSLFQETRI